MRYRTIDGVIVEADSLHGIAEQLWAQVMVPEPTIEEWMRQSAERARLWNGSRLSTASPEDHVRDMIATGLLTPLS